MVFKCKGVFPLFFVLIPIRTLIFTFHFFNYSKSLFVLLCCEKKKKRYDVNFLQNWLLGYRSARRIFGYRIATPMSETMSDNGSTAERDAF